MKRKKEDRNELGIAVLLVAVAAFASFMSIGSSETTYSPTEITGLVSRGEVAIMIGAANTAPNSPSLTEQENTQETTATFLWANYSDPEGDPTTNQFQLSTDYGFSTLLVNNATADSPYAYSNLTLLTIYYWRVRTCDDKTNCSDYSNDSFFTYSCPGCAISGGGRKKEYVNITCIPDWQCSSWIACGINRVSTRSCFDANNCISYLPKEYQSCIYDGYRTEVPKAVSEFFIGNFARNNIFHSEIAVNELWKFIYKDIEHTLKITEINEEGFTIEIGSYPQKYFIQYNNSVAVDVDDDSKNDILVRPIGKKGEKISIAVSLIEEKANLAESINLAIAKLKPRYVPLALLGIVLCLIVIIIYQNKKYISREKKIDKKLLSYVMAARKKGFADSQIRNRLLNSGIDEVEVDFILDKAKKS